MGAMADSIEPRGGKHSHPQCSYYDVGFLQFPREFCTPLKCSQEEGTGPGQGRRGNSTSQISPRHTCQNSYKNTWVGKIKMGQFGCLSSCNPVLLCTEFRDFMHPGSMTILLFHFLTITMLSLSYPHGIIWVFNWIQGILTERKTSHMEFQALANGWNEGWRAWKFSDNSRSPKISLPYDPIF